ncbi:MAG: amidohydrolase family protein, partial [Pseudomonadota bacterium]
ATADTAIGTLAARTHTPLVAPLALGRLGPVVERAGRPDPADRYPDAATLRAALADGTIDAVATDHAPHSLVEKEVEFEQAAFGMIGLETAVPLVLELVRAGQMSAAAFVTRLSAAPAALFGLPGGTLADGAPADVTVIDPEAAWTVEPAQLRSRSRNTPFAGRALRGRAVMTIVGGAIVYPGEPSA